MKILVLTFSKKIKFWGLFRPSTLKTENVSQIIGLGYVYIEESFDTIFNMGFGGC